MIMKKISNNNLRTSEHILIYLEECYRNKVHVRHMDITRKINRINDVNEKNISKKISNLKTSGMIERYSLEDNKNVF